MFGSDGVTQTSLETTWQKSVFPNRMVSQRLFLVGRFTVLYQNLAISLVASRLPWSSMLCMEDAMFVSANTH